NAPAPPSGAVCSKGPSMLQSCGTSSFRQSASAKSAAWAPSASPLRKRQSSSKSLTIRGPAGALSSAALAIVVMANDVRVDAVHNTDTKAARRTATSSPFECRSGDEADYDSQQGRVQVGANGE